MSSSAQELLPQVDLGNTFGALLIGVTLSAVLFGLTNVQTFIYFQTHRDTGMSYFKLIVRTSRCLICQILDALHLALIIHCIYYYLVTNYANFNVLTEIVWSFKVSFYFGFWRPCSTYDMQLQIIMDVSCFTRTLEIRNRCASNRFSSFLRYICKFDMHCLYETL
ncbi:hypothetical protein BDR05DRAFT_892391 [Suillus weaverae]|nr:hypothetical protein BDR05DRAFT_892391 [Suillus weaverae]